MAKEGTLGPHAYKYCINTLPGNIIEHFISIFWVLQLLVIERSSFKTKDKKHSIDYATIYVILPCQGKKPYFVLYNSLPPSPPLRCKPRERFVPYLSNSFQWLSHWNCQERKQSFNCIQIVKYFLWWKSIDAFQVLYYFLTHLFIHCFVHPTKMY